jgi:hypothetical protein
MRQPIRLKWGKEVPQEPIVHVEPEALRRLRQKPECYPMVRSLNGTAVSMLRQSIERGLWNVYTNLKRSLSKQIAKGLAWTNERLSNIEKDHVERPSYSSGTGLCWFPLVIGLGPIGSSRFTISMADMAASTPLFPAFVAARSIVCSMDSIVNSLKAISTPSSSDVWAMPFVASPATYSECSNLDECALYTHP